MVSGKLGFCTFWQASVMISVMRFISFYVYFSCLDFDIRYEKQLGEISISELPNYSNKSS